MVMKFITVMASSCITANTTDICAKKEGFRPVSFKKLYPEWYAKYEEIKNK